MTVVFIDEPSVPEHKPAVDIVSSRGFSRPRAPIIVLSPDLLPTTESSGGENAERPSALEADGYEAQHAALYGRYLGQLQARIERAWMRPRTPIGANHFSCRARIQQDRKGNVINIRLDHCTGTEFWQHSLIGAIKTASPLPAPPDPSVYADRLWLSFTSEGFDPRQSPEGFEPESRSARVTRVESLSSPDRLGLALKSNSKADRNADAEVVHLTIIGTKTEVTSSASRMQ